MKLPMHLFYTTLLSLLMLAGLHSKADAQEVTNPGDITFGGGISNGTSVGHLDSSEFGLSLHIYYGIMEEIRGGIGYTYYFISENNLGAHEFDIEGQYYFRNEDNVILYGLGGINFATTTADSDAWGPNAAGTRPGINAGLGLEYDFGNFNIYGEPRVTLGGFTQFRVTVGVRLLM